MKLYSFLTGLPDMYSSAAHLAHAGHSMIAPSGTLVDKNKDPLRGAAQTLFFTFRTPDWTLGNVEKQRSTAASYPNPIFHRQDAWLNRLDR